MESRLNWEMVFGCVQNENGSEMEMKDKSGAGAQGVFFWCLSII